MMRRCYRGDDCPVSCLCSHSCLVPIAADDCRCHTSIVLAFELATCKTPSTLGHARVQRLGVERQGGRLVKWGTVLGPRVKE
ncbi:hypothetical protein BJV77DRAFT_991876 [Russula vinacea]|nr:hypothetical protein BJV77DRAFT_991876 [Russula vinacea]